MSHDSVVQHCAVERFRLYPACRG